MTERERGRGREREREKEKRQEKRRRERERKRRIYDKIRKLRKHKMRESRFIEKRDRKTG